MTYATIRESYPSLERFEDILEEARFLAQTKLSQAFVDTISKQYASKGADLKLNEVERLKLRQLSTGTIK
jgi:hypothetical protein